MKLIRKLAVFVVSLVGLAFFSSASISFVQAQVSCSFTASPSTTLNQGQSFQVSIAIPPALRGSTLNPCSSGQKPCFEIQSRLLSADGVDIGSTGVPSIQRIQNNIVTADEPGITNTLAGGVRYWLWYDDGSNPRAVCDEPSARVRFVYKQSVCQAGTFQNPTIEGTSDRNITVADSIDIKFDGSKTSNFANNGFYMFRIFNENNSRVYPSNNLLNNMQGNSQGQLGGASSAGPRLNWTFHINPLPGGTYRFVVQPLADDINICGPYSFNVDPGDGSKPPIDINQPGSGGEGTSGSLTFTELCTFAGDPGTKSRTDCETCAANEQIYTPFGCIPADPQGFIENVLKIAIGIAGGIAFLMMLYAGFTMMMSSGNPEKLNSGKEIFVSAIAGLLLIIFSAVILRIIGVDILKIPGFAGG